MVAKNHISGTERANFINGGYTGQANFKLVLYRLQQKCMQMDMRTQPSTVYEHGW